MTEPDLFGAPPPPPPTAAQLNEERRYGFMDALTGYPREYGNSYRATLSGERLRAYDKGHAEGRQKRHLANEAGL